MPPEISSFRPPSNKAMPSLFAVNRSSVLFSLAYCSMRSCVLSLPEDSSAFNLSESLFAVISSELTFIINLLVMASLFWVTISTKLIFTSEFSKFWT